MAPFRMHAQPMADVPGRIPGTAGETPALPKTRRPALSPVVSGRWYKASARDLAARDKYQFQWWAVSLVEAQPFQGKKKGADNGIDGLKIFRDLDRKEARRIIVSVKGGENGSPVMVKNLFATIARDKA